MEKNENITKLLNKKSFWVVRLGSGMMLLFLTLLFFFAYFIEYPEYLVCKINIISENHTKKIIARETGEIRLAVNDFDNVFEGQKLGMINSTSNNILKIKPMLDSIKTDNSLLFNTDYVIDKNINLGNAELFFLDFLKNRNDYFILKNIGSKKENLTKLNSSLTLRNGLIENVKKEKEILLKKLSIEKENLNKQELLLKKGVISEQSYNESRDKFYSYENSVQDIITSISRTNIDKSLVSNNISNLKNEIIEDSLKVVNKLVNSFNRLIADVEKWEYFFNFYAPTDGQFFFSSHWSNNQIIKTGEMLGSVVPKDVGEIFCEGYITTHNSGKVEPGQDVKIYLDSYRFEEYGLINGVVDNISKVPKIDSEDNYLYKVNIRLIDGLKTRLGHKIDYIPNLNGSAKIVTKEINLLDRLFHKVKRLKEGTK